MIKRKNIKNLKIKIEKYGASRYFNYTSTGYVEGKLQPLNLAYGKENLTSMKYIAYSLRLGTSWRID